VNLKTDIKVMDVLKAESLLAAAKPKLYLVDPPYNIGQAYLDYDDSRTDADYWNWCSRWLKILRKTVHAHGAMWLVINEANLWELQRRAVEAGWHFVRLVVWYNTFGQANTRGLAASNTYLLYFSACKSKRTFNADDPAVRVPSMRQLKYNDKRANAAGKLPDAVWILSPSQIPEAFQPEDATWSFSRVCGTFKDREATVPNQLPVALCDRIIRLCSNPGDTVCDTFLGTGTVGVAAVKAGRNFVGMDISEASVSLASARIKSAL
jgi:DNA modification methylase